MSRPLIIAALLVLGPGRAVLAAPGGGNGASAMQRIEQELQLTDQQAAQVQQIMQDERGKMRSLMQSGNDRDSMRSQFQSIRNDMHQRLSQVLSAEQMQKFDQLREQMRGRHRGFRGGNSDGAGTGAEQQQDHSD